MYAMDHKAKVENVVNFHQQKMILGHRGALFPLPPLINGTHQFEPKVLETKMSFLSTFTENRQSCIWVRVKSFLFHEAITFPLLHT